jgi:phosphohistidine phosphatase
MLTLLLMRHAKSDWEAEYGADHDRPLNQRGRRSARLMGRVLTARGLAPGHILSSTAVRARTTAELASEAGGWGADLRLDIALYESGPEGVLEAAASAPNVNRLMLVGHQPTWSMLAERLTGEPVEMKTAAVALVGLDLESWSGLPGVTGTLAGLLTPAEFEGSQWSREP